MKLSDAQVQAENLLDTILKTQPNLMSMTAGSLANYPETVAKFCSTFIDDYAAYLMKREN
jgi:hypothetical protein